MFKQKNQEDNEENTFLKLFQQYERNIYRMAYVYVKNKDDALDIVQEVAYRSFLKYKTLNDLDYFKTWIIKIAINCSIDFLRKNKKIIFLDTVNVESFSNDEIDIPLSLTLQDLISLLNEHEKTIILLKFYYGYTFDEISEIVDQPLSTVKSVVYRSLEKLRKQTRRADIYG